MEYGITNESLRAVYNSLCEEYKHRLAITLGMEENVKYWYWIGDNIGETLDMDDWILNMGDIVRIVDNNMTFEDFSEWYTQWAEMPNDTCINLHSWLMGARPEMLKKNTTISFKANKEKIYISLPIAHYDLDERMDYAERVEKMLENDGYIPVNPFDNGLTDKDQIEKHMKADFKLLLDCDKIFMCKGWEKSRGCLAEFNMAVNCGIKPIYEMWMMKAKGES